MQEPKNNIILTNNADETKDFAKDFAKNFNGGDILCLYGNLGSGKTTFVQGLAKGLGIKRRIFSPTFIIVRSYKLKNPRFVSNSAKAALDKKAASFVEAATKAESRGKQNSKFFYHIDLYRIQTKQDLLGVGIDEIFKDKDNIVAVEWAEKLFDLLPKKRIDVRLKYTEDDKREIEIKKYE